MFHEIQKNLKNRNQIFTSKFLILYASLGSMEHVIKEKRPVGILTKSLFENK